MVGLVLWTACSQPVPPAHGPNRTLIVESADGIQVSGTLYEPKETIPAPGVLLLPMAPDGRAAWEGFAQRARQRGLISLALDLPPWEGRQAPPDYDSRIMPLLDAARAVLIERGANPGAIAVMGAGVGANLALRYAQETAPIAALVLISPGQEYRGITIDPTDGSRWNWPLLLMISTGDAYAAAAAREMNETAPGFVELREYDGSAHGIQLLDRSEQANEQILLWFSQIIGPFSDTPPA